MDLPPFLLFMQALYLSKLEESIPNSSIVSLTHSGIGFTLGEAIECWEDLGSIVSVLFFSSFARTLMKG